jgi:hypothetical protein
VYPNTGRETELQTQLNIEPSCEAKAIFLRTNRSILKSPINFKKAILNSMFTIEKWDWSLGTRQLSDLGKHAEHIEWREESQVSPDGESIAAVVKKEEFSTLCVNGEFWSLEGERVWYPRYSPDGRLAALAMVDGEWTMAVDDELWEDTYAFLWGTTFADDGSRIAAAVQNDMRYGMVVDGTIWPNLFDNANNFALSPEGSSSAAVVQVISMGQADTETFEKGCYTVAVDGVQWERNFVNAWTPVFNLTGKRVACQVRTTLYDYTIAVDGVLWSNTFSSVWEPCFDPRDDAVFAPVRTVTGWSVARDGKTIWDSRFAQLWDLKLSGDRICAAVATRFGHWTVAVDGTAWKNDQAHALSDMRVHKNSGKVAARAKVKELWTMIVDGQFWDGRYERIWSPVISPDGTRVAAKVEDRGSYTILLDGVPYKDSFDEVWDPIFSPNGDSILIKAIKDNKYFRTVAPLEDFRR